MSEPLTEEPAPTETSPAEPTPPAEPQVPPDAPDTGEQDQPAEPNPPGGVPDEEQEESPPEQESDEPVSPAPPETQVNLEAMDKRFRAIERSATGYAQRVAEWGQEFEQPIVPCGVCAAFLPGFVYSAAVQPLSEEQASWMREALGEPDRPQLIQAGDAHMCEQCDGWGRVLTGSKRPDYATRKCHGCNGRGWNGAGAQESQLPEVAAPVYETVPAQETLEDPPSTDPWGREPSDPGYYKLPYVGMPEEELPPSMRNHAHAPA